MATKGTPEESLDLMICIICCGDCNSEGNGSDDKHIFDNFLTVLGEYLGANISWPFDDQEGLVLKKSCLSCSNIFKSVAELHYQMKCIKMKMEWKLETLIKSMEAVNKTPTKLKQLKHCLKKTSTLDGVKEDNMPTDGRDSTIRNVMDFRKKLISKCNNKLATSNLLPKVVLKRELEFAEKTTQDNEDCFIDTDLLDSNTPFVNEDSNTKKTDKESKHENSNCTLEWDRDDSDCYFDDIHESSPTNGDEDNEDEEKYCPEENAGLSIEPIPPVHVDAIRDKNVAASDPDYDPSSDPDSNQKKYTRKKSAFLCAQCPKRFARQSFLNKHIKMKHSKVISKAEASPVKTANDVPIVKVNKCKIPIPKHPAFLCPLCTCRYSFKGDVIRHMRKIHAMSSEEAKTTFNINEKKYPKTPGNTEKKFECDQCSKVFSQMISLEKHIMRVHSAETETPNIIPALPDTGLQKTNSFVKQELEPRIVVCDVTGCHKKFQDKDDLDNHKKLHGSFKCDFCEVVKNYAPNISIHEAEKHAVINPFVDGDSNNSIISASFQNTNDIRKTYKCPRCEYSAMKRHRYIEHHLETHLNLTTWDGSCEICKAHFPSNAADDGTKKIHHFLTHHSRTDMAPSELQRCDLCSAFFRKVVQLVRHKTMIHGVNTKCTCPYCGKLFSLSGNLKMHMKSQHDDENLDLPLACDVPDCKKRFPNQAIFDWHMLNFSHIFITQSLKIVNCPQCNKECLGEGGLKTHLRTHKRADYVCEQCGASFKRKHVLHLHYEFHKGPENWEFQCQECGKKCATKYRLKEHMNVHSDEKRFKCKVCGQAYKYRQKLRAHVNTVHAHEGFQDIARKMAKPKHISRRKAN